MNKNIYLDLISFKQLYDKNYIFFNYLSTKVIMGGGRRHFLPTITPDPEHPNREGRRLDGRNLAEDWAREKKRRRLRAQYIHSREQLAKLDPRTVDYLLGNYF